jgi:putative spermidine/putrescine transport system substrate-binding protein
MTAGVAVRGAVLSAAAMLVLASCGGSSGGGGEGDNGAAPPLPDVPMQQSVGAGEGKLSIVIWTGYAEDGSSVKSVDWVTPFEQKTGCKVDAKVGNTSDEMVQLMRTGQYDGVSASGDASLRLVYGGDVAPVNTDLVPNYADIQPFLKDRAWNSVDGQMYGIPHGWGANLLVWNPEVVKTPPTSWAAVFGDSSQYKDKVTAYDSPIYIADAALYLMKHQPDLGIVNPYALDQEQLDAAVELLKGQRKNVGEYWNDITKEVTSFESGNTVIGTSWQYGINTINLDKKVKVKGILPSESSTAWSDTWMVSSEAKHPNCMYKWMDWMASPKVQADVAVWFGEAPANPKACPLTSDKTHCKVFYANDKAFSDSLYYWTTPTTHCLPPDTRGNACTDYSKWTQAWTEIKG